MALMTETGAAPPAPLTNPWRYLVRMGVFLVLTGFVVLILYKQIWTAFLANPGLNGLILGVMLIGIILAVRQVGRLFREIAWVNGLARRHEDRAEDDRAPAKPPILLAPMAALIGSREGRRGISLATMRTLRDSLSARLDESREIVRYLAGLLVFLGLLGTFWGLIETVNSVGRIIGSLRTGSDAAVLFDELKTSLSAPLAGMGISFSASLFGLAGSLVLGFLDLQSGQAQSRFYTELEDWLATTTASNEAALSDPVIAAQAMANLAEGIDGLVQSMRSEQKLLREWMETQALRDRDIRAVLERFARERAG